MLDHIIDLIGEDLPTADPLSAIHYAGVSLYHIGVATYHIDSLIEDY